MGIFVRSPVSTESDHPKFDHKRISESKRMLIVISLSVDCYNKGVSSEVYIYSKNSCGSK